MLSLLYLLSACSNSSDLNAPKIDNPKNPMLFILCKDKAREEFKNMKEKKQQLDSTNPMHLLHVDVGW